MVQTVFKRYEFKYIISLSQKQTLLKTINDYMSLDNYGRTTIRNLYFDTDTYLLIRRSIERPVYKEKLRIRSYEKATENSTVFAELKKKYQSVVYKRRVSLCEKNAMDWLNQIKPCDQQSQITNEIDYFIKFYQTLHPVLFLSYEREAYYSNDGSDFRITFDENILCRETDLSLKSEIYGTPILQDGITLMEIKCSGGIPLWLTDILSREKIYKTAFSKYGTAYKNIILPKTKTVNSMEVS